MKELTEEQALAKAAALCSSAEKCTGQIRAKLAAWGMSEAQSERITARLRDERYIDDGRYCRAFCADKLRYNHWGRIKIHQALRQQGLDEDDIAQGLDSLDSEEYEDILKELIRQKGRTLRDTDPYVRRQKLLRHAYAHGFEPDFIMRHADDAQQ